MEFLPLFFQLKDKPCLIVGGGHIALRKASLLRKAGAVVNVVGLDILPALEALVLESGGGLFREPYSQEYLDRKFLVIAATDNETINKQVSKDAHDRHIPVNVVDNPKLCSVILPAIIDRSPVIVAVSSGGKSPVLTRLLRTKIESIVPAAYGQLAHLVSGFREKVKARFSSIDERRFFWERIFQGPASEMIFAGNEGAAKKLISEELGKDDSGTSNGEVYLVGAGPGDPDLLTFKALRLMQKADVVLYDRLVSESIIDLTRRDAERIYVGKARSNHSVPQSDINGLLVKLAKEGKRVLRLKGGDPFIFGRGGEEIEELAEFGIPFQVVPGVTAASGCAAYAGIPLTHRDYAQSVRFVTGHLKDGSINLPWHDLVNEQQTLVFYMGLVGLPVICEQLIAHGREASTPIALVQQGTTLNQRVYTGTLESMAEKIAAHNVKAPTLLIIGSVVQLREKLSWFEEFDEENQDPL